MFWAIALVVSGGAFAFVTLVVIVKGGPDLREMLRQLRSRNAAR